MTPLEQALREALTADVDDVGLTGLVADVRRGARRRRARRTVAAAAGVAAAVALVIGIGSAVLLDGGDSPEPAPPPSPTVTLTDGSAVTPELPGRSAMAAESADGVVWVTVRERDCRCAALWRHDGDGWRRVFDFPNDFVERLALAPNARDGLAANVDGTVWSTHDGGRTWAAVGLPRGSYLVGADAERMWAVSLVRRTAWSARTGTDSWEQVDVPGSPWGVDVAAGAVVLDRSPSGEGDTTSVPVVTRDGGATWRDFPYPCTGENRLHTTDAALFALCPDGARRSTVYRSTDAATWHAFGTITGLVTDVVALAPDRVLVRSSSGDVLVTEKGVIEIDTGLGDAAMIWDSALADDAIYLTTTAGVRVSTDRGVTWGPAE